MNDEIAALEEPLQAVLLLGPLEEAQALPTAPVLQPIIHRIEWRLGRPGRFHHVIKSDKVPVYTRWLKRLSDDDDDVMISSM